MQFVTITIIEDDFGPTAQDDNISIPEDNGATNILILVDNGNGVDVFGNDGSSATPITIITGAVNGTSVINENGTVNNPTDDYLVYTPNANWFGTELITYGICDATGDCDQAIVTITVNSINDSPVVDNENITTDEDLPVSGDLTGIGDLDIDGNLVVNTTPIYGPSYGGVIINSDGTYTYTPNLNFNGIDTIVVQICDDGAPLPAICVNDTIFINVNSVNDSPTGDNELAIINEDDINTLIDLDDNDNDIDGDLLTLTFPNGNIGTEGGIFVDNGNGTVTYTPVQDFYGNDTLIYSVCDPTPACVIDTVIVTVNPVNDTPIVDNENVGTMQDVVFLGDLTDNGDFDVDGILTATTIPVYGPFNGNIVINSDGTYSYSPNAGFIGNDTIVVEICDNGFPLPIICVNDTIFITVTNNLTPIDNGGSGNENMIVIEDEGPFNSPNVLNNNTDPEGGVMTVTIINQINGIAVYNSADSTISYTPNQDFCGLDTVLYDVCDVYTCNHDTLFVDVNCVNDAPISNNVNENTLEDTPIVICVDITDVEGDACEVSSAWVLPINGLVTGFADGDSCFIYTPNSNFNGLDSLTVTVCDIHGDCDTVNIIINVLPVNDNPIVIADTLFENTEMDNSIIVCISATDTEADTMGICSVNQISTNGLVTEYSDSTMCFTYTPNINYIGNDTMSVVICDGNGGSDTVLVVIETTTPNYNPVITESIIDTTITENGSLEICLDATDANGDTLGICDINPMPTNGVVSNYNDSTLCFTYTPNTNYIGQDTMSIIVCDGNGGSDTVLVVIETITPNYNPVITESVIDTTTTENVSVEICIEATDANGDTLGICDVNPMPVNGVVSNYNDSTLCFTYTPNTDYIGQDTMSIIVCDGNGGSDTVLVVINTTEVIDDNPIVEDTIYVSVIENTPLVVCIPANIATADSLGICNIDPMPVNGVVSNYNDSTLCFTYSPNTNFVGQDTLIVVVCNSSGVTNLVTVFINVKPTVDPNPNTIVVLDTLNITTPQDESIVICIDATDSNSETLGICSVLESPLNGQLVNVTDSTLCFSYIPNDNYNGEETITLIICDGNGESDTITVVVSVLSKDELFIPGGFSPNGDNVNDVFVISGISSKDNTTLIIFNRWGNKIYEASPYNNNWDGLNMFGISEGQKLPVGTYFYIFKINDKSSKGYIYLNR